MGTHQARFQLLRLLGVGAWEDSPGRRGQQEPHIAPRLLGDARRIAARPSAHGSVRVTAVVLPSATDAQRLDGLFDKKLGRTGLLQVFAATRRRKKHSECFFILCCCEHRLATALACSERSCAGFGAVWRSLSPGCFPDLSNPLHGFGESISRLCF